MNSTSKNKNSLIFIIQINILFMAATLFLQLPCVYAQNKISPRGVAVFSLAGKNNPDVALTDEAVDYIKKIFTDCGRFMPAGKEIEAAYSEAVKNETGNESDIYRKIAELLKLDLYVLVSVNQTGNIIHSDLSIVPLNNEYRSLQKRIGLRSKIKLNMPLKLGREIAIIHKDLPVNASVIKSYGNNVYLINAGEWQGIKNGGYKLKDGNLEIIQSGRFESIVKTTQIKNQDESILIETFPDVKKIIKDINDGISRNTVSNYELRLQDSPEKRLLEGICVINMCGNLCIPGYGAFLSTSYLGFKDTRPDWTGVTLSTTAIATHFLLPEILAGFKINFFPWKGDSDKTEKMQNLQTFLWFSLPVTFSVAYMDQLAHQFTVTEHVPPFFNDRDNAAAIFSLFLPGGGLYYKGYRLAGWGFYFSEMLLAGYGVYESGSNTGKYAFFGLGAVKLLDIILAYFIEPSYSFYNFEKESEPVSFGIGMIKDPASRDILTVMITLNLN